MAAGYFVPNYFVTGYFVNDYFTETADAGAADDDTQVMTTREGMIDSRWFGFFLVFGLLIGGKKWR